MTHPILFPDHYFKISIPGLDIGMYRDCAGLSFEIDVFEWAEGGNYEFVWNFPSRVRYPHLTLSRGLTDQDALQQWVWGSRLQPQMKDLTVELRTADGKGTRAWTFAEAWPVRWTGPRVASDSTGMANESLDIVHKGLKVG